jgi:hypothetical protein
LIACCVSVTTFHCPTRLSCQPWRFWLRDKNRQWHEARG